MNALKWLTIYTQTYPQPPTPESLAAGERAAHGLLMAEKPAGVDDAAWNTTRAQLRAIGHNTLGFIAAYQTGQCSRAGVKRRWR